MKRAICAAFHRGTIAMSGFHEAWGGAGLADHSRYEAHNECNEAGGPLIKRAICAPFIAALSR